MGDSLADLSRVKLRVGDRGDLDARPSSCTSPEFATLRREFDREDKPGRDRRGPRLPLVVLSTFMDSDSED